MILVTALMLVMATTCCHATLPPCMRTRNAEDSVNDCSVEDIVRAINIADFSLQAEGNDLGDADIASPCGKAQYLATFVLELDSPIESCERSNSDQTGNMEDNEIEEEISEPDVEDVPHEGEQQERVNPVPTADETDTPADTTADTTAEDTTEPDPECYTREDGGDYFGTISVTEEGLTCQMWSESSPHRPVKKYRGYQSRNGGDIMFPSHFGEHNYCRTLGNLDPVSPRASSRRTGPWCYTTDPDTRWQYCDVPAPSESC